MDDFEKAEKMLGKKAKLLKLPDNKNGHDDLTVGKIYDIIGFLGNAVVFLNDNNTKVAVTVVKMEIFDGT